MCIFNKLENMMAITIGRDMKRLLIEYVCEEWKKKVDNKTLKNEKKKLKLKFAYL